MRWLIGLLVVANLAFAALAYVAGRRQSPDAQLVNLEMNADKVRLLKSAPAAPAAAPAPAPAPDPATKAEPAAKGRVCMEWGNFSAAELERARAKLAEAAPKAKISVRELAEAPAWWVYIPPVKTREEVDQTVAQLKELGVTEMHVVTDSERWRNAVSLGIFKTEEAAVAHLAQLKERKVKGAVSGQRNNLVRLSALSVVEPSDKLVETIATLKAEFAGSEIRAGACPGGR
jgi:hypothetical protein